MRWLTAVLVGMLWACAPAVAEEKATTEETAKPEWEHVAYREIPMEMFAATVKNWDVEGEKIPSNGLGINSRASRPVYASKPFSAVIRNLDEWNEVFSPDVWMQELWPTAPPEAFFETKALVVLSVVSPRVGWDGRKRLRVVELRKYLAKPEAASLNLHYNFDWAPELGNSRETTAAWVKHTVLLAIRQEDAQLPLSVSPPGGGRFMINGRITF